MSTELLTNTNRLAIPFPMKRKDPAAVALGRKGGRARMTKMSPEERKRIAHLAATTRWEKKKGKSESQKGGGT
jgi:hypothetical protein